MAAWINVTLADIERGLENPKTESRLIQIFVEAEKRTGIPRIHLYIVWIATVSSFLLLGFATNFISIAVGITYPFLFIYLRLVPNSSTKLPKFSYIFVLFTLVEFFLFPLPHLSPSNILAALYTTFKRILQFRCFLSWAYGRSVRFSVNSASSIEGTADRHQKPKRS